MLVCTEGNVLKGNRTNAELRYREKDIISPSTQSFAPIKG